MLLNFDGYGKIYLSSSVTERNKKLVKVCLTLVKVNKRVSLGPYVSKSAGQNCIVVVGVVVLVVFVL